VAHDRPRPPAPPPLSRQRHIWQGRFKAFPIQSDGHLLTVLRYVERNALRASLVSRAQDWPWSSLAWFNRPGHPAWLTDGPCPRPADWLDYVNQPHTDAELQAFAAASIAARPSAPITGSAARPPSWASRRASTRADDRERRRKSRMSPFFVTQC